MSKTVAIIGGGPAGIVAAKEALEAGLAPVLFESAPALGGLWRPGKNGVWENLRTNLSRHSCAFSDHPWAAGTEDFPAGNEVGEYLQDYAEAFRVTPHVRLRTPIDKVERQGDGWAVGGEFFDHVVVASGIFQTPALPRLEGMDDFRGQVLHGADYKTPEDFHGLNVAVVGSGFSGNEIASELAGAEVGVTQVVRTPTWVIRRMLPTANGPRTVDFASYSRAVRDAGLGKTPAEKNRARGDFFTASFGNPGGANALLKTDADTLPVTIADDYLKHVRVGNIQISRGGAAGFNENGLVLDSGEKVKADAVIFCTGYRLELPFLPQEIRNIVEHDPEDGFAPLVLHKETFHPDLPGMAFVGVYRGPFFAVMELQARWAALSFSGQIPAPSAEDMHAGLAEARAIRAQSPRPQFPRGDYVGFADDIAQAIGVKPDIGKESPEIADMLYNGPLLPAHFRLQGPGAKRAGALAAIVSANKKTAAPLVKEKTYG